ncbi:MAG TPA: 2Fe-2S iron-sulfur cluster binding domain-containing protein [Deltaproteobacteria bacterium]|nr:2Fe-2S iron-sulfur cluster binding domain-containing protein [Deltaproteobacteria bacterium]
MAFSDVVKDIEGYQEILKDIEILRKYGFDYSSQKGNIGQVIENFHPKRIEFSVSEIIEETASTKTIRLVPKHGSLPPFQAGQYINVYVEVGGVRTSRPYSISSPPNQAAFYDITVRRVGDGFVSDYLLDDINVGDSLESTGPAGNFYYNPLFHGNDLVFIAGGSGITPFMSMIREVTDKNLNRRIHLIYGCDNPDDVIFGDELSRRSRMHANFTWDLVVSTPPEGYQGITGFITAELMKSLLGDISSRTFYLCGPEAMYTFCGREIAAAGIPPRKVRVEMFGPPKEVFRQPGWPQGVSSDAVFKVAVRGGRTIDARACEPLMISLERAGIVIPALCRSGECSLCRTKLISGKVYQPSGVKLRKSDRDFGYIHACMSYPIDDLEIMI